MLSAVDRRRQLQTCAIMRCVHRQYVHRVPQEDLRLAGWRAVPQERIWVFVRSYDKKPTVQWRHPRATRCSGPVQSVWRDILEENRCLYLSLKICARTYTAPTA